jgi:cytochrome c-type biogenesis protein CcmH
VPRWRVALRILVTAGLAAVVLFGLGLGLRDQHGTDRVRDITTRLRCPVCQGESVADSPSQNAQEIATLVKQQVDAGWTTPQIEQYFVNRYGSFILLDPPRSGSTLWLWVAPVVVVTVGLVAMLSRLDRSRRRRLTMAGAGVLGLTSVALLIVLGSSERSGRAGDAAPVATLDPTATTLVDGAGRDLSTVSNAEMETVIAKNPNVIGMRLALVERYLKVGDIDDAYRQTTAAIDLPATDQEYEHAIRLHGWVTALKGAPVSGAQYLRAALTLSTDDRDARWFLANVEWHGLGNAAAATAQLDILRKTQLSDSVRQQVDALAADIAAGRDAPSVTVAPGATVAEGTIVIAPRVTVTTGSTVPSGAAGSVPASTPAP